MKKQTILNQLKKLMISIDLLVTSLDNNMQNQDFVKIASETKKGETELMKFKIVLAGIKKVELDNDEKDKIKEMVKPLQKKIKKLSIVSETNALFFGSFLNVLSSLISASYNDKGKMAVQVNNNRISHSI